MNDIVTRLKDASPIPGGLYSESAEEIERLQVELEKLRADKFEFADALNRETSLHTIARADNERLRAELADARDSENSWHDQSDRFATELVEAQAEVVRLRAELNELRAAADNWALLAEAMSEGRVSAILENHPDRASTLDKGIIVTDIDDMLDFIKGESHAE